MLDLMIIENAMRIFNPIKVGNCPGSSLLALIIWQAMNLASHLLFFFSFQGMVICMCLTYYAVNNILIDFSLTNLFFCHLFFIEEIFTLALQDYNCERLSIAKKVSN